MIGGCGGVGVREGARVGKAYRGIRLRETNGASTKSLFMGGYGRRAQAYG